MTNHRCQYNLTFSTIKKETRSRLSLSSCFVFTKRKAVDAHGIICEKIIAVETYVNWLE